MTKSWPVLAIVFSLLLAPVGARAGGMPYMGNDNENTTADSPAADDAVRMTLDQTKMIRLDEDAQSVIVTNPDYATVMLDTPRLLIAMPRRVGSTAFTVINSRGQVIMHKNIIVMGTAAKKYVRIRRVCGNDSSCEASAYYYCPDGCYEITPLHPDSGTTAPPAPIMNSSAPASSESDDNGDSGTNSDDGQPSDQGPPR